MLLSELVRQLSGELSSMNRVRTMNAYATVLRGVQSYMGKDPHLGEVFDSHWLMEYQCYLLGKGLKWNTLSFYMRTLRGIYNKAVDLGWFVQIPNLFSKVYTGLEATSKRSIAPELIVRMGKAKLSGPMAFCRDIFMLCFYLQGMNLIDLAYLKKTALQGDQIVYYRKKTRSMVNVYVRPQALKIIKRYIHLTGDSDYLFPILTDPGKDERTQYESTLRTYNRRLKKLAEQLEIRENLTSYVARHSWATMAYHNKVSTATISEALGHKTEAVTRIYLASFGLDKLCQASDVIMRALRRCEAEIKDVRHFTSDGHESDANVEV